MIGKKKRRGERQVIAAAIVGTTMFVVMALVVLSMSHQYRNINSLSQINRIARTYLLQMEAKGCLSAADADALLRDLQDYGMSNIWLGGNFSADANVQENHGKASFGEEVFLEVSGDLTVTLPESRAGTFFFMQQTTRHICIVKKGVASQ